MTAARLASAAAMALALAACSGNPPNPYSPGYSRIAVTDGAPSDGRIRKGYDRTGAARQTALVPDACITPDTGTDPMYLPSGCANALNLQQMVENERDLERGQEPGPSMAAPSARAARRHIDGANEENRRRRLESEAASGTQVFTGGSVTAEASSGR